MTMRAMGEIDTRPFKPVHLALSLFQHQHQHQDHNKKHHHLPITDDKGPKEMNAVFKELASYKLQLEAKDSEHLDLLHKLHYYQHQLQNQTPLDNDDQLKDENRQALASAEAMQIIANSEKGRADELEKQLEDARVELAKLKNELQGAKCKVGELRARAEQAVTRADAAERARVEVEMELNKLKDKKHKRKAALLALKEETALSSRKLMLLPPGYVNSAEPYRQPLSKILNLDC